MIKNIKYLLILIISAILILSTNVFAINLNLQDEEDSSNTTSNSSATNTNRTSNTTNSTNTTNSNTSLTDDLLYDTENDEEPAATVSNIKSSSSTDMSFILNVFIIVIGILLILLAIAILIRLKK